MERISKLIVNNLERFILFAVGVLVAAIVSELLEETVSWSTATLVCATVLLVVSSVYFFSEYHRRLLSLVDKMEVTVEYISEPFHSEGSYTGIIYRHLKSLLESATSEILYFSAGQNVGGHPSLERPIREEYFKALENRIMNSRDDFKYIVILQTPQGSAKVRRSKKLTQHCLNLIEIKDRLSSDSALSIDVLRLSVPQRHNSFLVIDRRYIVLFLTSTDAQGVIYRSGVLSMEDRGGRMVKNFVWYFSSIERLAQPVAPADIVDWEQA